MSPFVWIRQKAKEAFLGGIADAQRDVEETGVTVPALATPKDLPALPVAAEAEPDTPKSRSRR